MRQITTIINFAFGNSSITNSNIASVGSVLALRRNATGRGHINIPFKVKKVRILGMQCDLISNSTEVSNIVEVRSIDLLPSNGCLGHVILTNDTLVTSLIPAPVTTHIYDDPVWLRGVYSIQYRYLDGISLPSLLTISASNYLDGYLSVLCEFSDE